MRRNPFASYCRNLGVYVAPTNWNLPRDKYLLSLDPGFCKTCAAPIDKSLDVDPFLFYAGLGHVWEARYPDAWLCAACFEDARKRNEFKPGIVRNQPPLERIGKYTASVAGKPVDVEIFDEPAQMFNE